MNKTCLTIGLATTFVATQVQATEMTYTIDTNVGIDHAYLWLSSWNGSGDPVDFRDLGAISAGRTALQISVNDAWSGQAIQHELIAVAERSHVVIGLPGSAGDVAGQEFDSLYHHWQGTYAYKEPQVADGLQSGHPVDGTLALPNEFPVATYTPGKLDDPERLFEFSSATQIGHASLSAAPEPATLAALACGLGAFLRKRRR